MKEFLGYVSKRTEQEIERVLEMDRERLGIYLTNFGIQILKSTQDGLNVFKGLSNGILLSQRKTSFY